MISRKCQGCESLCIFVQQENLKKAAKCIKNDRYIKCDIADDEDILKPNWCPTSQITQEPKKQETYQEKLERWKNVKSHLTWDEIEVGKSYHIPNVMYAKAKSVIVTNKTSYSITCKAINPKDGVISYSYIYPSDVAMKYIVPLKSFCESCSEKK